MANNAPKGILIFERMLTLGLNLRSNVSAYKLGEHSALNFSGSSH